MAKAILVGLLASATAACAQNYCWVNFAAGFNSPYGADTDGSDNIYIADRGDSVVRKITPGGSVTTLSALTGNLVELVVNKVNGNIYYSDLGSGNIKKSVPPYTTVTTLAGGLGTVIGLGVDSATDTIYVGSFDQRIYQVTSGGVVTTLAGDGTPGLLDGSLASARFNNPCGIAVIGSGGSAILYVADRENNSIRKVDIAGNAVTTVAGNGAAGCIDGTGNAAQFTAPTGVTAGPDGNLYIADQDNGTVRKMTQLGVVTTIGGNCVAGTPADGCGTSAHFGNVGQVAVDSTGLIYVADRSSSHIEKGTPPAPTWCWVNFASPFNSPYGIDSDSSDNLYVADRGDSVVKKVTPGGTVTTLSALTGSLTLISVNKVNGNIYYADLGTGNIIKSVPPYSSKTTLAGGLGTVFGLGVDGATDTVYAGDMTSHQIKKITSGGVVTVLAGSGAAGLGDGTLASCQFDQPAGIAVVGTGSTAVLYVVDRAQNAVRKVDIAGDSVTTPAGNGSSGCVDGTGSAARFTGPTGITQGPDGSFFIADQDNGNVRKMTSLGVVTSIGGNCAPGTPAEGCGTDAVFGNIGQVAVDSSGHVYAADRSDSHVKKGTAPTPAAPTHITSISFQTAVTGDYCWSVFASGGAFNGCYGATVDSDGTIYAAGLGSGTISKISPGGAATSLGAVVPGPVELVISTTTHNLYVGSLDGAAGGVYKIVPPYGAGNVTHIDGNYTCFGLGVDSTTDTVYAGDRNNNQIRVMSSSGPGSVLAGSGGTGALNASLAGSTFNAPCGIAVVGSGGSAILYVADQNNGLIRKVDVAGNSVSTLAGSTFNACNQDGIGSGAGFANPTGCTLGPDGNLYIADQDNLTVRKVTPAGVVTTIGGNADFPTACARTYDNADGCGSAGHFSDVGQCGVSSGGIVYVADRANNDVKKGIPPASSLVVQIDFTGGASDTASSFTLQHSSLVTPASNYTDVAATFSQLGSGSFRATVAPNGVAQYYRIKHD